MITEDKIIKVDSIVLDALEDLLEYAKDCADKNDERPSCISRVEKILKGIK
jgi:hypothetical protein